MFTETQAGKFTVDTNTVIFQGKPIRLTNITLVFTPEQREKRKREIELILYSVFKKYAEKT